MKKNALIGYSGFVGSTLLKQTSFDELYRSTNIGDISNKEFDLVVCAAAPAQKWLANSNPEQDKKIIDGLIQNLKSIKCKTFVLISTVDVFKNPLGVCEDTFVDEYDLHAYGLHRRFLEKFVEQHFPSHLIIRLPGLVGPGLRKNIIFDFLNGNNLDVIESRSVFQFYPMINLWYDIKTALTHNLKLVHFTAEPISVSDVAEQGFGLSFSQELSKKPVSYDMQTKYAELFNSAGKYQYSVRDTIQAVRAYAQSEPVTLK